MYEYVEKCRTSFRAVCRKIFRAFGRSRKECLYRQQGNRLWKFNPLPLFNQIIAIKLADYFNCTLDYLLGRKDENYATEFKPCPEFGKHFDDICKKLKVSRSRLHDDTNIAESVMRYWIKGKTKPSVFSLTQIADALNVSIDYLIGREA